jgi:glycosyltransferase involved in cell wall biosynthesis
MTRSHRICMVTSGLGAGGSELQFVQLACGLRRRGWGVSVISLQRGGVFRQTLADGAIDVRECPTGRLATPAALARLLHDVRASRPGLVHTQAFRANLWGRLAAITASLPVVASVRATYSYLPAAYYPVERLLAAHTDCVVTPSLATAGHLVTEVGVPREKVVTIPNGVDTTLFSPDREGWPFRRRWRLGSRFTVLTLGRLVPQKNHAALLQAFARFSAVHPDAVLLVAGRGPLEARLREHAQRLRVSVVFLGELSRQQVADAMAGSDAMCLMSDFEGSPNAVLEAMAAGKPVVASAVDGVVELVDDGVDGLLVGRGDVAGMAGALERLADEPSLRRGLGQAARARVEKENSVNLCVDRHVGLYESLA